MTIDIAENRTSRKWSRKELIGRVLWAACQPFFRYSPRLLWEWRNFLLRRFGATIGKNVHIHPSVRIFIPWNLDVGDWSAIGFDVLLYNLGPMKIGSKVTISQRAHLCGGSHDFRDAAMPLLKCTIEIGNGAWVCTDAFVGPNVTIGSNTVVGACSVVVSNIEANVVIAGNPAKKIRDRE